MSFLVNDVQHIVKGSCPTAEPGGHAVALPAPDNGCKHAGVATAMKDGKNPERPFVGRVDDQVVMHGVKAQWSGGQVGSAVAAERELRKKPYAGKDVAAQRLSRSGGCGRRCSPRSR
jgi:hypothetical protein